MTDEDPRWVRSTQGGAPAVVRSMTVDDPASASPMTVKNVRGVSTTMGYVLSIAVITMLLTGVLFATTDFVDDQREQTVRNELRVLGQQVAADVAAADRLVGASESGTVVTIERDLPQRVTGSPYSIEVDTGGTQPTTIVLSSIDPDVTVEVTVWVETDVSASTVPGGGIEVVYTGSALEVLDA